MLATYDTSTLILSDDGRGADVVANDGVYSGYFTSFTLEGRYNVKVTLFILCHDATSFQTYNGMKVITFNNENSKKL